MRSLNHRQLEAFHAVFITGSMTAAGRHLGISQPAVSRLIHDLEAELQLELFQRQGHQIRPTQEGMKIYQEVSPYLSGVNRIRDLAAQLRTGGGGRVRIAVMPMLSMYVLPEAISRHLLGHANTEYVIHSDISTFILAALRRDEFDIGFARIPKEGIDLRHEPMPASNVVCVLPIGHPLADKPSIELSDLDGEHFVSMGGSSSLRLQIDAAMNVAGFRFGRRIETLFSHTVDQYVAKGLGIAVADPLSLLNADFSKVTTRPLQPPLQFDFSAVYPPNPLSPELVTTFVRAVEGVVADLLVRPSSGPPAVPCRP